MEKEKIEKQSAESSAGLHQNLGLPTAISTVVGCVIGSGIFFKPQAIYTVTGGAPGLGMLAWVITGLVSIAAALTFAEIAVLFPETGGIPTYLSRVYGPKAGFLAGWVQVVLFYPAMVSALAVACAQQAALFIGDGFVVPCAVGVILLIVFLNTLGSRVGGGVQVVFTICKMIPLILLMVFGFLWGKGHYPAFSPLLGEGVNPVSAVGQLMVAVLFAFEGWTAVGAISGEMKNTKRDLPRAIIGGVSIITAVYFVMNLAYLQVLPAEEMAKLPAPASAVAVALFGEAGGKLGSAGIVISVFGACNGFVFSGSRVAYFMASQGLFPGSRSLSRLNKNRVPGNCILLIGALGSLLSMTGQFNLLTDLAVFSSWTFYTLTFMAVIRYRNMRPDVKRSYRVPGYPLTPAIAIGSGVFVIVNQLCLAGIRASLMSLGSIAVMAAGLAVYEGMRKRERKAGI